MAARRQKKYEKSKPFIDKYSLKTKEQLQKASLKWVLENSDMHTVPTALMNSFDEVDKFIPLSGTKLSHLRLRG